MEKLIWEKDYINKIICGDCLEVMKGIPDESVDLVITSPPYNIEIDYGVYKDNLEWQEYLDWCNKWISQIRRILKSDGRFVINILVNIQKDNIRRQPLIDFSDLIRNNQLHIHGIGFWIDVTRVKYTSWGSWQSASCPYIYNPYEALVIGYRDYWKKIIKGQDTISKKIFILGVRGIYNFGTTFNRNCPAVFPLKLPLAFVDLLSFEDDIVLDPFLGSGTTAVACKQLNRRFIGIEINPEYCKIAEKRLKSIPESLFNQGTL